MARHSDERPHPLRSEATWIGIAGGVGLIAANLGLESLATLPGQVEPIIQAFGSGGLLYAANRAVAKRGERHVTPTTDPRDDRGRRLVPIEDTPEI